MADDSESTSNRGAIEEFLAEFREVWRGLPDKGVFGLLLLAWLAMFQVVGNPLFGYGELETSSLLRWMYYAYTNAGSEDTHGVLIPFVVLGLMWWKREQLLAVPKRFWSPALLPLGMAALLHVVGYSVQQQRISIVGLFLGIYSLMALVWGRRFAAACFFPYILFGFCIPVGLWVDTVTLPLRQVSTDIAVTIASTGLGIDVIQDGVRIMDPAGTYQYEVAAACSGIRSLVSLAALTTIYGFVNFHTWWKPWLFMALAVPLAIVGNIIRLTMIIVGTEAFNTSVGMFIHEWFGFVTFAVALGVVLVLGAWLRDEDLSTDPGPKLEPNAA